MELSWTAPADSDPLTYIVLRADAPETEGEEPEYNTIGRGIAATSFTDNSAEADKHYFYKVKAVDYAGNRSKDSEEIVTGIDAPTAERGKQAMTGGISYDLSGKPVTGTTKGILIQHGKKIFNK
jgi:hypothetical protein